MCHILGGYLTEANTAAEASYIENITAIWHDFGFGLRYGNLLLAIIILDVREFSYAYDQGFCANHSFPV